MLLAFFVKCVTLNLKTSSNVHFFFTYVIEMNNTNTANLQQRGPEFDLYQGIDCTNFVHGFVCKGITLAIASHANVMGQQTQRALYTSEDNIQSQPN